MSIQSIGSFGDNAPRPAATQGAATVNDAPKPDTIKLQAAPQQTTQPSNEEVREAVREISKKMEAASPGSFEFSIDKDARMTLVRITDRKTGDLIRQVPAPELVELAKDLDRMQGLLLKQQA
jgi:flagellar protein FlaG